MSWNAAKAKPRAQRRWHQQLRLGSYLNPKTASTPPTCVAVAKKPRVIADLADTLRASSGILGFLPTWRLTQTLEDEHTDCTHYCLDSGVHDAVLDAVAFELM